MRYSKMSDFGCYLTAGIELQTVLACNVSSLIELLGFAYDQRVVIIIKAFNSRSQFIKRVVLLNAGRLIFSLRCQCIKLVVLMVDGYFNACG